MSDGFFATLVSKDENNNAVSNPIFVELSDGTNAVTVTGNALSVTLPNLEKAEDAAHSSGDKGIMALAVRNDAGTALAGTDGDYIPLTTDSSGKLWVSASFADTIADDSAFTIGTSKVLAAGFLADETATDSVDEGDIGAARMTLDRKLLTRIVGATDANRLDIDVSGHAQVDIAAISVTAFPVSATTALNSETNPIYVHNVNTVVSGSEICNYDTTASVAGGATDNHDYTVTGATFLLTSIIASFSGAGKFEVQTGPVASLVTKAVGFIPKQGGTQQINFDPPVEVPVASTGTVRIIRTNREGSAADVYSTIIGNNI